MAGFVSKCSVIGILSAFPLLLVSTSHAKDPDSWMIVPDGRAGAITVSASSSDLIARYGSTNVHDEDIDIGEGVTEPGTVLFGKDPKRSMEILWKDPETKRSPKSLTIRGEESLWHAVHQISLGTSLEQLEKLNGRSFELAGFEWDYQGTVTSWKNGLLAKELDAGNGRLIVRLEPWKARTNEADIDKVSGDKPFLSDNPIMKRINPRVYELVWEFP